jgi:UrcA family protein
MLVSTRLSLATTAALLCVSLSAQSAAAQAVRVSVGDLSTPVGAVDFDHRLEAAARRLCGPPLAPPGLDLAAGCRQAVHNEALDQLSHDQQRAYAEARRQQARWESR